MKTIIKLLVLSGFFLFFNELISQEWISTNGGRVYYYGYPMQLPAENVDPPNSIKTIAEYELIEEISLNSFEGIDDVIGDADHDGLNEIYIAAYDYSTSTSTVEVYEF